MNYRERKDLLEAEHIILTICNILSISYFDLQHIKRKRKESEARFIVTHYLVKAAYMDCQIGNMLNRDRTTILFYKKQVSNLIDTDPIFREKLTIIGTQL